MSQQTHNTDSKALSLTSPALNTFNYSSLSINNGICLIDTCLCIYHFLKPKMLSLRTTTKKKDIWSYIVFHFLLEMEGEKKKQISTQWIRINAFKLLCKVDEM